MLTANFDVLDTVMTNQSVQGCDALSPVNNKSEILNGNSNQVTSQQKKYLAFDKIDPN